MNIKLAEVFSLISVESGYNELVFLKDQDAGTFGKSAFTFVYVPLYLLIGLYHQLFCLFRKWDLNISKSVLLCVSSLHSWCPHLCPYFQVLKAMPFLISFPSSKISSSPLLSISTKHVLGNLHASSSLKCKHIHFSLPSWLCLWKPCFFHESFINKIPLLWIIPYFSQSAAGMD